MEVTIFCLQVSGRLIGRERDVVIYLHTSFIIEALDLTKFDNVDNPHNPKFLYSDSG